MTGLGFDFNETGDLTSIDILFSDDFGGQMTYLDEMRDTVGLSALRLGLRPRHAHRGAVPGGPRRGRQVRQGRLCPPGHRQLLCRDHGQRRRRARHGLVRRRADAARPGPDRRAGLPLGAADRGRDALDRQHGHPEGRRPTSPWPRAGSTSTTTRRTRPRSRPTSTTSARSPGAREVMLGLDAELANNPLIFPPPDYAARLHQFRATTADGGDRLERGVHQGAGPLACRCAGRSTSGRSHRMRCCCPGLLWLAVFYVYPAIQMFLVSLWTGNIQRRLRADLELGHLPAGARRVLAVDRPLDRLRRAGHDPGLRARLPARLRDRLPRRPVQEPAAVPRHRAVLHELPAAHDLAGRSSSADDGLFLGPLKDDRASCRRTSGSSATPAGGHLRHHLQLPAVHDAAAVRRAREDRPPAARGGRGPLRRPVAAAGTIAGGIVGGDPRAWSWASVMRRTARSSPRHPAARIIGGLVGDVLISEASSGSTLPARPAGHLRRARC